MISAVVDPNVLVRGVLSSHPTAQIPPSITRDLTDIKWVALALDGDADYLVTLDRRH